jgi:uncharacterized membrane protein
MIAFLGLFLLSFLFDMLLLVPAVLLFLLQFPLMRRDLKKEYPEDWLKYALVILIYEVVLSAVFFGMATTAVTTLDLIAIYNLFILILFVIVILMAAKFLMIRKYVYGSVIFSTKDWVGVYIKSDLFSKVFEANYAVENPLSLKVKKNDRVKIRLRGRMGKARPYELMEVMK